MNLLSIVWNVSPIIHQFSATYGIRWYGICFAIAFVSAYYVAYFILRKENFAESTINKIAIVALLGGVIGARLGHCLFYEPTYYLSNSIKFLHIWEGGMASHGGAIGIMLGILFLVRPELPYRTILARILLVTPLAGVFFRLGNLMNSEIYGTVTDMPWGFIFVQSHDVLVGAEQAVPRHPTQIYEMICYGLLFVVYLLYCIRKLKSHESFSDHFIIGMFGVWVFGGRFLIEFLKMPQVSFEQGLPLNMGQWLSLPFVLYGLYELYVYRRTVVEK